MLFQACARSARLCRDFVTTSMKGPAESSTPPVSGARPAYEPSGRAQRTPKKDGRSVCFLTPVSERLTSIHASIRDSQRVNLNLRLDHTRASFRSRRPSGASCGNAAHRAWRGRHASSVMHAARRRRSHRTSGGPTRPAPYTRLCARRAAAPIGRRHPVVERRGWPLRRRPTAATANLRV